ncbi:MAG: hypothetical protein Q8R90_10245 [Bacteroidales bacterium]|nr:hypothetical protein [Bacteroidales bacterium]
MKKNLFRSLMALSAAFVIFSCTKEDKVEIIPMDKKVIVINQGNYTEHSASISLYDEVTGEIQNRVFENANGISIGATIISGTVSPDKKAYLICNNPDKIEIIDSKTGKVASSPITDGLASPRSAVIFNGRIYVTNWDYEYNTLPSGFWEFPKSYIAIYDLSTRLLIKKVLVGTDAEGLVIYGSRLFVAVKEGIRAFEIAGDNLTLINTIKPNGVTGAAKHLTFDKNGRVWASFPDKGLVQADPVTMAVLKVVDVPVDYMDGYITSDNKGEKILTYNTNFNASYMPEEASIYSVDINSGTVSKLFSGTYFYGIGVSPSTGNIFTAEVSFTSNSVMKVVGPDGKLKSSATAGVGTCRYLFF